MKYSESLKKNREFQYVYKNGISVANKYLIMYALVNGLETNRVGISASKKVGNSVIRHKITRLIRESYRLSEEKFLTGYDFVFIPRANASDKGYKEIASALIHVGKLHKVIK